MRALSIIQTRPIDHYFRFSKYYTWIQLVPFRRVTRSHEDATGPPRPAPPRQAAVRPGDLIDSRGDEK